MIGQRLERDGPSRLLPALQRRPKPLGAEGGIFAPPFDRQGSTHLLGVRAVEDKLSLRAQEQQGGGGRGGNRGGGGKVHPDSPRPRDKPTRESSRRAKGDRRRSSVVALESTLRSRFNELELLTASVIDPNSPAMVHWDGFMMLLLLFTAVFTPFEVAFLTTRLDFIFWLNRFVDLGFAADISINMRLSFYDEGKGMWIINYRQVRRHYLTGWFLIDALSLAFSLLDCLGVLYESRAVSQLKILRLLKLLKLFKLLRIVKLARIVKRMQSLLGLSHASKGMLNFLIAVLCVIHWQACLWRLGPQIEGTQRVVAGVESEEGNWIHKLQSNDPPLLPTPAANSDLYLASIEFSLMVMVMGYGNTTPVSSFERSVAVACMVVGGTVYAYTIGNICGMVSMRDPATTQYQETVDLVNKYLEENRLPLEIRIQLREYMAFSKQLIRAEIYHNIQSSFPPSIQGRIACYLNEAWIANLPYFQAENPEECTQFTMALATRLEMAAYPPEERIYMPGEPATHLFIIRRGIVAKMGRIFGRGMAIGDDMIMTDNVRTETAMTLSYADCSTLSQASLQSILDRNIVLFRTTRRLVRRAAARIALRLCVMEIGKASLELRRRRGMSECITSAGRSRDLISYRLVLRAKAAAKEARAKRAAAGSLGSGAASAPAVGDDTAVSEQRRRSALDLAAHLSFWTQRADIMDDVVAEQAEAQKLKPMLQGKSPSQRALETKPPAGSRGSSEAAPMAVVRENGALEQPAASAAAGAAAVAPCYAGDGEVAGLLRQVLRRIERVESMVEQGFEETVVKKYNTCLHKASDTNAVRSSTASRTSHATSYLASNALRLSTTGSAQGPPRSAQPFTLPSQRKTSGSAISGENRYLRRFSTTKNT